MSNKTKLATSKGPTDADATLKGEAATRMTAAALELERARRLAHDASAPDNEQLPEPPSRLDTILETVADQGKFEVYRQIGGGNKSKVGVYPINEYPDRLETIAATYKGGTFTVIFKDAHGRIRGQDTPTFDAVAYSAGSAPSNERSAGDAMDRMLERMEARDESNRRDMAAIQTKQTEMTLEMMKLLANRPAAEAAPQTSFPEMIKLVREMLPPPVDPLASLKGTMEMMMMLKDGASAAEPQSPWVVALEKGLELLTPIISVLAQKASSSGRPVERPARLSPGAVADVRRLPPASGEGPIPVPARTPDTAAPPVAEAPIPFVEDPQLKEYAGRLLSAAIGQVRPSIVAQLIVDSVTQESVDEFEAMIDNDKLLETLLAHEPRLSAHRLWLENVLKETEEKFDEAFPTEPEEAAPVDVPAIPAAATDAPAPATDAPAPAPVAAAPVPPAPSLEATHA